MTLSTEAFILPPFFSCKRTYYLWKETERQIERKYSRIAYSVREKEGERREKRTNIRCVHYEELSTRKLDVTKHKINMNVDRQREKREIH